MRSEDRRDAYLTMRRDVARSNKVITSNVDAIYEEYPFLSKIITRSKVKEAKVKRWDEKLLSDTRFRFQHQFSGPSINKLFLVDSEGDTVARVGGALFEIFVNDAETVDQTLARIGNNKVRQIRYAVGIWDDTIILWRLPTGHGDVSGWLRSVIEKGREDLRRSA